MFLEELHKLFTQTSWIVALLLVVGLVFCFIEAVVPGFGVNGILGIVSFIAAIVCHAIFSGSIVQVFIIVLLVILIFVLIFLVFIRSAKYGILGKSALVENKTAIPTDYVETSKDLKNLIGKQGIVTNECRPVGKMKIGDEIFEVLSNELIEADCMAEVKEIKDNKLYVKKIEGEKEEWWWICY